MSDKQLYIFVEGNNDEDFFNKIIIPTIKNKRKYTEINVIKYAQKSNSKINDYIKSINSCNNEYLFIADIDDSKCVTRKKEKIKKEYKNIDSKRIVIVKKEIESCFLAGVDTKKMKIKFNKSDTENISKEEFNNLIPKNYDRTEFMIEILKHFFIDKAKKKNKSFKYFCDKYM